MPHDGAIVRVVWYDEHLRISHAGEGRLPLNGGILKPFKVGKPRFDVGNLGNMMNTCGLHTSLGGGREHVIGCLGLELVVLFRDLVWLVCG